MIMDGKSFAGDTVKTMTAQPPGPRTKKSCSIFWSMLFYCNSSHVKHQTEHRPPRRQYGLFWEVIEICSKNLSVRYPFGMTTCGRHEKFWWINCFVSMAVTVKKPTDGHENGSVVMNFDPYRSPLMISDGLMPKPIGNVTIPGKPR